jgi:hypothetical protein
MTNPDKKPPTWTTITREELEAWRKFRKESDERIRRLNEEMEELRRKYGQPPRRRR